MPRKALKVECSHRILKLIEVELKKRNINKSFQKRLEVVYLSLQNFQNQDIAKKVGYTDVSVRKWRKRWHENWEELSEFEKGTRDKKVSDIAILKEIELILSDLYRSGSSSRITNAEKIRIQALACEDPSVYNLPISIWTHETLSEIAKNKLGIMVSPAHLGRILKKQITTP